jgi:membrane protease subunit HflK
MTRILPYAIGLLLLAYLATGLYQVEAGELAVVRRFGKVHHQASPGLNIGLPWPFDKVDRVRVQQQQLVVGFEESDLPVADVAPPGQLLTGDNNLVNVQATVIYTVDPQQVVDYVLNRDRVAPLLARATESALASVFAEQRINDVLYGRSRGGRGEAPSLEPEVQRRVAKLLEPYRLGVSIAVVNLAPPKPPAEVAEDFAKASLEETKRATAIAQARVEAASAISKEKQAYAVTVGQARSNKQQHIAQAKSKADAMIRLNQSLLDTPNPRQARRTYYMQQMSALLKELSVRHLSDAEGDYYFVVPPR